MPIPVQTPTSLPQTCLPSTSQIAISPSQNTPSISAIPAQISGSDVVNTIIAISILVGVILRKPPKSNQ